MEINAETFHVESDIAKAWTLPVVLYTDPKILAIEKDEDLLPNVAGDRTRQPGREPRGLLHSRIGRRAVTVCAGYGRETQVFLQRVPTSSRPAAEGCGSRKVFRCGYHGWTYDLDGKLISATEIEGVQGFCVEDFSLMPVRVEEWFNLVLVNLDQQAASLADTLGELSKQAEKFSFPEMKLFERRTYDMKCNWKTYVDNYLEGYHLPSVHPELNRELDYNAYTVEPHPNYVRQFSPIRGAQPGDAMPRRYQQAREDLTTDYFWIFPNWMLNCYPDNISLNIVLPIEPERTMAIFEWYLPENDHSSAAARASVEFSDQVQIEDIAICEVVQKNLQSRSYSRGRFSVRQEKGVHAFHRMYAEIMQRT